MKNELRLSSLLDARIIPEWIDTLIINVDDLENFNFQQSLARLSECQGIDELLIIDVNSSGNGKWNKIFQILNDRKPGKITIRDSYLSYGCLRELAEHIKVNEELYSLSINNFLENLDVNLSFLAEALSHSSISELSLEEIRMSQGTIPELEKIIRHMPLESFKIGRYMSNIEYWFIPHFHFLMDAMPTSVKNFTIINFDPDEKQWLAFIKWIENAKNLEFLDLRNGSLDQTKMDMLYHALSKNTSLKTLNLSSRVELGEAGVKAAAKIIESHPTLENIVLGVWITEDIKNIVPALVQSVRSGSLTSINLDGSYIGDDLIPEVIDLINAGVGDLNLDFCSIKQQGILSILQEIGSNPGLYSLNLDRNDIDISDITVFEALVEALEKNTNLEYLRIPLGNGPFLPGHMELLERLKINTKIFIDITREENNEESEFEIAVKQLSETNLRKGQALSLFSVFSKLNRENPSVLFERQAANLARKMQLG